MNSINNKLKAKLTIKLTFENEKITNSIYKSTNPENQETPEGVESKANKKGKELFLTISSKTKLIDLVSTVEDYFEKIDLSYKTISSLANE